MLHRFDTKKDVLNWLYAIGEGQGLPRKALTRLTPFLDFRLCDQPSSFSTFKLVNIATSEELVRERTPNYSPTMVCVGDHFRPELDDFELKFSLPAVAFAHYEAGFDRTGDFELAFFDIRPLAALEAPLRYSARDRLYGVISHLTATDLKVSAEQMEAQLAWFNGANESEVRKALSEGYGQDFTTDEALDPYLRSYSREWGFLFVFLQGKGLAALAEFEAHQKAYDALKEKLTD